MARPKAPIDKEVLEKLAERQWTEIEIAAFFKVSTDTIRRRFASLIDECRQRGKAKLRDLQWKRALEGSDKILLHMSKHYLKQHEKIISEGVLDATIVDGTKEDVKKKIQEENQRRLDAIKNRTNN